MYTLLMPILYSHYSEKLNVVESPIKYLEVTNKFNSYTYSHKLTLHLISPFLHVISETPIKVQNFYAIQI